MKYGRYEIIKEVGRGSMGVVYEAQDPQIGRTVALKVLRQDRVSDENLVKRFIREARAIGRLSQAHIVTIYDVGEDQGNVYIAMEFLEGEPLDSLIRVRKFSAEEAADIGAQVAETLHYAHGKGVVHRDIKPSNIIIQPDGQIKITDFGIAHIEDSTATLQTQAGEIMGTPAYMSPEQVLGKPVDGRSDIFSLGVVLYELSTGKRPFGGPGKNLATVFNEIIQENPTEPALAIESGTVPAGLSGAIMKCLDKSPDGRFQAGKDLAQVLRGKLNAMEGEATAPSQAAGVEKAREVPPQAAVRVEEVRVAPPPITTEQKEAAPYAPPAAPARLRKKGSPIITVLIVFLIIVALAGAGAVGVGLYFNYFGKEKAPSAPAAAGTATVFKTVRVESHPSVANLFVDGEPKGTTPAILQLSQGSHRVRVSMAGYEDKQGLVQIGDAKEYRVSLILKAAGTK
jgi:eukaryotic-like serine/threonine-protein kinase